MSTVTQLAQAAQEQTLQAVRQSQEAVVEAVRLWAKTVEKLVPEVPATPLANQLPTPEQAVDAAFDFAGQLLAAQREFAKSVLAAAAPVLEKQGKENGSSQA